MNNTGSSKAIQIFKTGEPEVMQYQEIELPEPKAHEVLIRQAACGVNYIDVYFRNGLYTTPLPSGHRYLHK